MRAAALVLSIAVGEAYARPAAKPFSRLSPRNSLTTSGGEESLAAGVARAAALVDAKQLDEAEALLLELRARDARRADLPPELRRGFAHLFEARADEDKDNAGPCDALAALAADAEDWEAVYDACRQAMARGGATDRRRALALRARRSTCSRWSSTRATSCGAESTRPTGTRTSRHCGARSARSATRQSVGRACGP